MPILPDPGPLQVERLPDGRRKLLRPLHYQVDGEDETIAVPAGFLTDYSSDPVGLLDWTKVDVAGVVHDYLYHCPNRIGSRFREDLIWFKIARAGKWRSSWPTAGFGLLGILLFGWLFRNDSRWVRRRIYMTAPVVAAFWAVWAVINCFYFEPTRSWAEAMVCMALILMDGKLILRWYRSSQRRQLAGSPNIECRSRTGRLHEGATEEQRRGVVD